MKVIIPPSPLIRLKINKLAYLDQIMDQIVKIWSIIIFYNIQI